MRTSTATVFFILSFVWLFCFFMLFLYVVLCFVWWVSFSLFFWLFCFIVYDILCFVLFCFLFMIAKQRLSSVGYLYANPTSHYCLLISVSDQDMCVVLDNWSVIAFEIVLFKYQRVVAGDCRLYRSETLRRGKLKELKNKSFQVATGVNPIDSAIRRVKYNRDVGNRGELTQQCSSWSR